MAFEGLLRAWSDERVLFRDATLCIADKPAGVACTESAAEARRFALEARLEQHGLGPSRVLLPLPERASGATLLALTEAASAAAPDAARLPAPIESLVLRLGVEGWALPAQGTLPIDAASAPQARLMYALERRNEQRALLRVECGVPVELALAALRRQRVAVVGDTGGPAATRLMLHVSELRGAIAARAPLPVEFESWLAGHAVPGPERFAPLLADAGIARFGLAGEHGALRLLGEEAGEIAGLCVERYGAFAVVYVSSPEAARHEQAVCDCLMDLGAEGVYVKRRVRADLRAEDAQELAPPLPLRGSAAPAAFTLGMGRLRFEVSLGDGHQTGLFLDQRTNWTRLGERAGGGELLNLFCYTGAFTLGAALAGASTTSVDLSGRALSRLSRNLEASGLSGPAHRVLKADVLAWLARARRGQRRYDAIVLDPPSFGTRAKGVLSTRRDNPGLLEDALGLLQPGGSLLAVSHHRKISERELSDQVARACARLGLAARCEPALGGWDCPTLPGVSGTKSVLARLT